MTKSMMETLEQQATGLQIPKVVHQSTHAKSILSTTPDVPLSRPFVGETVSCHGSLSPRMTLMRKFNVRILTAHICSRHVFTCKSTWHNTVPDLRSLIPWFTTEQG
jgi:hypothetical protein